MRLRVEQLEPALKRGLVPIYFFSGDEPLQLGEAADAVRSAARDNGFDSREVFHVEGNFDWKAFLAAADSLSLFSERRLLDLRIPSGKPGAEGAAALTEYIRRVPDDTVLLVTAGKLAGSSSSTAWFKALDKIGVIIQVRPPAGNELLGWLERRMLKRGLKTDRTGLEGLAARVEGNLLAAAQEIDKLYVLHGAGPVDAETILDAVSNSSRFDVFSLTDSVLLGQGERAARILRGLKAEDTAPAVVLWALAREARLLANISWHQSAGLSRDAAAAKHKVWDKRKPLIFKALRRLSRGDLLNILRLCAQTDRTIKGMEPGDPWNHLLSVSMYFAGQKLWDY